MARQCAWARPGAGRRPPEGIGASQPTLYFAGFLSDISYNNYRIINEENQYVEDNTYMFLTFLSFVSHVLSLHYYPVHFSKPKESIPMKKQHMLIILPIMICAALLSACSPGRQPSRPKPPSRLCPLPRSNRPRRCPVRRPRPQIRPCRPHRLLHRPMKSYHQQR